MGLATTFSVTCDCCGYVFSLANAGYTLIQDNAMATNGAVTPGTNRYYCATYGCNTGMLSQVNAQITTKKNAHVAAIVGGVIPQHPA